MVLAMPLVKYDKREASKTPDSHGVYALADEHKKTTYIGEGKIRIKLLIHLKPGSDSTLDAKFFKYEETHNEHGAKRRHDEELSRYRAIYGDFPRFNQDHWSKKLLKALSELDDVSNKDIMLDITKKDDT